MYRKVLIAALLCLGLSQTANAQYYPTMQQAITASLSGQVIQWNASSIYRIIPAPLNGTGQLTYDEYIVWCVLSVHSPGMSSTSVLVTQYSFVIGEYTAGYVIRGRVGSGATLPTLQGGNVVNVGVFNPTPSQGVGNRIFYSRSDIDAWYNDFNAFINTIPTTAAGFSALVGDNRQWGVNKDSLRTGLTTDTDNGGMSDWDEVYFGVSGLNINDPFDDVDCYCNPCCSCECVCGGRKTSTCDRRPVDCECHKPLCHCGACCSCKCTCEGRWLVICDGTVTGCSCHSVCTCSACCSCTCTCGHNWGELICGGGRNDCYCHNICVCSACCSCTCICGHNWGDAVCGGGRSDCACHNICTCGACCSCECTCGYTWPGNWCNGQPSGCDCHKVCTCGACCSCRCTCGFWKGEICEGRPGECVCHSCICGACCSCKCTCGQWSGPTCDGTPSGCVCHKVCVCGACCSCWCICGNWSGPICNGTPINCSCHACSCNVCCSCKCTCGNWQGVICGGKAGDCSCHYRPGPNDPNAPEQCTCGACCSCKCVCGKWHLQYCPKTPDACPCHAPIEGDDWYPTAELQESLRSFEAKLNEKIGFNFASLLENVQPSSIQTRYFNVPSFAGTAPFTVTIDFEALIAAYSTIIGWFRSSIKWSIYIFCLIKVLQLLFKF